MKTTILHSRATGFSVTFDAGDGMAVQVRMDSAESAAALANLIDAHGISGDAWNKEELAEFFEVGDTVIMDSDDIEDAPGYVEFPNGEFPIR